MTTVCGIQCKQTCIKDLRVCHHKNWNACTPKFRMGVVITFPRCLAKILGPPLDRQTDGWTDRQTVEGGAAGTVYYGKHEDWILLKTDVKNSFNSVSRSHLLNQVLTTFPDIYNHAALVYSDIKPLIYLQRSHPVILSSQEGVH